MIVPLKVALVCQLSWFADEDSHELKPIIEQYNLPKILDFLNRVKWCSGLFLVDLDRPNISDHSNNGSNGHEMTILTEHD